MTRGWGLVSAVLVTTTVPATTTVLSAPTAAALQPLVDQWRRQSQAPGTIVAVRVGTGTPTIVVSGADARSGAPLDAHVPFAIASITKTFVGALLLDLVDEGDDAGPSIYSDAWEKRLLANLSKSFTADEILDFVHDRPLMFDPGAGVQYSNINMILLGKVVEAVTGTDLTTTLHQRLIGPLGLGHTYYGATEDGPEATSGVFTLTDGGPLVNTADFPSRGLLSGLGAAGGMVSNVDDLLTWSEKFLRAGAQADDDLSLSRFAVTPNGLGLGVVVFAPDVGGCVFARGCASGANLVGVMGAGSVPGTNSSVAYFPKWDLTIVAMATSSLVDVDHELVGLVLSNVVGDAKGS